MDFGLTEFLGRLVQSIKKDFGLDIIIRPDPEYHTIIFESKEDMNYFRLAGFIKENEYVKFEVKAND